MRRDCIRFAPPEPISKHIAPERLEAVELFIDAENAGEILEVISTYADKSRMIMYHMVQKTRNNADLYGREDVSSDAENIWAMKYKVKGKNIRIYCKEYETDPATFARKIVLTAVYHKKTQGVDKKLKGKIETYGCYEYDFE